MHRHTNIQSSYPRLWGHKVSCSSQDDLSTLRRHTPFNHRTRVGNARRCGSGVTAQEGDRPGLYKALTADKSLDWLPEGCLVPAPLCLSQGQAQEGSQEEGGWNNFPPWNSEAWLGFWLSAAPFSTPLYQKVPRHWLCASLLQQPWQRENEHTRILLRITIGCTLFFLAFYYRATRVHLSALVLLTFLILMGPLPTLRFPADVTSKPSLCSCVRGLQRSDPLQKGRHWTKQMSMFKHSILSAFSNLIWFGHYVQNSRVAFLLLFMI